MECYGGLRHKRGPYDGPDWIYGYRIPLKWFESGEAQFTLLPIESGPRPSMHGVVGRYAYEVKSGILVADMPDFAIADSLMELTKR